MIAVVDKNGRPLDPTTEANARHLLDSGKAEVYRHEPFAAIRFTGREGGGTQSLEYCSDVGYQHVGISIKSDKHEYVSEQRDLLDGEVERNRDRKKNRRARRNHLRYREPRFDDRKKRVPESWEKWFPPSLIHRAETQIRLFEAACQVFPIKESWFEMGKFDTQLLKALEEGKEPPQGTDYQHGERYLSESLRYAVFARDNYTCQCPGCNRNAFADGAILHEHHIGYWKKDRANRMSNLMTVCEQCHTTENHREGGKLYGLNPTLPTFKGATFMTTVRFEMYRQLKEIGDRYGVTVHMCYGAGTKCTRKELNIEKSHANDAYCIGNLRPKHRAHTVTWQKLRRNDRSKERFHDAVYYHRITGEKTKASELGHGRTKRNTHLQYEDKTPLRGKKKSKGHRSISWGNAPYPEGSVVEIRKEIKKKGKVVDVITGTRKITSAHSTLRHEADKRAVKAGLPHRIKPDDIYWTLDLEYPLSDGSKSTPSGNVVRLISRPIHKGWEKR